MKRIQHEVDWNYLFLLLAEKAFLRLLRTIFIQQKTACKDISQMSLQAVFLLSQESLLNVPVIQKPSSCMREEGWMQSNHAFGFSDSFQ